jgi:hypothetical protein
MLKDMTLRSVRGSGLLDREAVRAPVCSKAADWIEVSTKVPAAFHTAFCRSGGAETGARSERLRARDFKRVVRGRR